jgi:hypothetical protein
MAKETKFKVIEVPQPMVPERSLIEISGDRNLTASFDAFGPDSFDGNVAKMIKLYTYPETPPYPKPLAGEVISFREPTSAESILVASYDFRNRAKPQIFDENMPQIPDSNWLQLGRIVRTSEGVFANVPKYAQGKPIADEKILKSLLSADRKVNGIWLLDNDFGYAPYETFKEGIQEGGDFAEGGLARVLEHTEKTAEKLKEMTSRENYPKGVEVSGFGSDERPGSRVVSLGSGTGLNYGSLQVRGSQWYEEFKCIGYAFGILDERYTEGKK